MKWNLTHAILATLAYAELFEYPLTTEELYTWLITDKYVPLKNVESSSKRHKKLGPYMALSQLHQKVPLRKHRAQISQKKWNIARRVGNILWFIPTIHLIGVSGGLAMENTEQEDDIDFFVVVAPHTLWITRLCVLSVLELLGRRRKVHNPETENKICLNMLVDTQHLSIPNNERDIYSAHEVLQLVPLVSDATYSQFLQANTWVASYLPNAWIEKTKTYSFKKNRAMVFMGSFLSLFDYPARYVQLAHMNRYRTTEVISDVYVRFHPNDVRRLVTQKYTSLLKKYKVPLDSRFFHWVQ